MKHIVTTLAVLAAALAAVLPGFSGTAEPPALLSDEQNTIAVFADASSAWS
jgi:hypothetical protein